MRGWTAFWVFSALIAFGALATCLRKPEGGPPTMPKTLIQERPRG